MSWTRSGLAVTCALAMGLCAPAPAHASGSWEWPVDGAVTAGYGASYVSEQVVACTHGGVDIGASAGSTMRACVAGEVTFSGLVPAGEGERAWAVTVLTADGLRVTYLPLSRASVSKGADVGPGDPLGEVAATGDASSPTPHLHLGVRRGDTRLDPLAFLGERAAAPCTSPPPQAAPPAESVAPATPAAHGDAPAAPLSAQAPVTAPVRATVRASSPVAAGEPILAPSARQSALLPGALPVVLPAMPRVPQVAETPRVRADVVAADLGSVREVASIALVCLGLAGLAGACVWPVLRGALDGSAPGAPTVAPVRCDRA